MELAKKWENTSWKRTKSSGGAEAKKRKTTAGSEDAGPSSSSSSVGGFSSTRQSSHSALATYSRGKENESEQEINLDECCVSFRTFQDDQREGTGLEWVQCV